MTSVYALLSAVPGKERELLERLAALPGVVEQHCLFGDLIAVRMDEARLAEAQRLGALVGVREARVYHGHDAWVMKGRGAS